MARIQMPDFGNSVAQPGPVPDISPEAYGAGLGRTLQGIGQDAQQAAQSVLQREEVARRRELEKAEDLRTRTTTVTALHGAENDVAALQARIENSLTAGELDPKDAIHTFNENSEKILEAHTSGIPGELGNLVRAQVGAKRDEVRNRVAASAEKRSRDLLGANILQASEQMERTALTDRAAAVRDYTDLVTSMAPAAGWDATKVQKELATFREKTAFNSARSLVNSARDDRAALDQTMAQLRGKEFADLSPEKVAQLEGQILARKSALESAEQTRIARQEAAAARRDRQADAAVRAAQLFIDNGGVPDLKYAAELTSKTAGTAYAPLLNEMFRTAGQDASFAKLTPREQEAKLVEMRSQAAGNPQQMKRINNFERIASETKRQVDEDPLTRAASTGIVALQPLNFSDADTLATQIGQRTEAAATASARYGKPVSPLTLAEARAAADILGKLTPAAKGTAIGLFAKSMDRSQMMAFGAQVGGADSTLGSAIFAAANGKAPAAELMLRGEDAKKAGRLKTDANATADHLRIAKELDGVPWPTPQARDAAVKAAQATYDGLRDKGSASWREAIKNVTGELGEWNGSKVPLPDGWTQRRFSRAVAATSPEKLALQAGGQEVRVGNEVMPVGTLAKNMNAVKLIPAGQGRFALESGGQMVLRADGGLLRIKVED